MQLKNSNGLQENKTLITNSGSTNILPQVITLFMSKLIGTTNSQDHLF